MTKILILCHGNICRSPMGKFVLQDMVNKAGLADRFEIDSAAVSREELGNPVYPPCPTGTGEARHHLRRPQSPAGDHGGLPPL